MPLIEVDESELTKLRTAHALVERLGTGKTRSRLLGLVKEIQPNAVIPEIDAANEVMEEIKKRDEKYDALAKQVEEDREARRKEKDTRTLDDNIAEGRKMLRDAGYLDDGIKGVEEIMTNEGITSYSAAAALYEKQHPKGDMVASSSYSGNRWNFASPDKEDDTHKNWLADPMGQSQREVQGWLAEARGPVRRRA